MKKILCAVIIILCAFIASCSEDGLSPNYAKIQDGMENWILDEIKVSEVIDVLCKEMERYPEDTRLLKMRLELLIKMGRLIEARKDVNVMVKKTQINSYAFLACLISESIDDDRINRIQCYRDVYARQKKEGKLDYLDVITALMGEMPEAEQIKSKFLSEQDSEEMLQWYKEDLEPFDRSKFLPTNKGK